MDITRLAINFSTSFREVYTVMYASCHDVTIFYIQVSTTLVSMLDETTVRKNVDAAINPLTEHETSVRDYIIQKYFKAVECRHWEGVEVEKYQTKMKK